MAPMDITWSRRQTGRQAFDGDEVSDRLTNTIDLPMPSACFAEMTGKDMVKKT